MDDDIEHAAHEAGRQEGFAAGVANARVYGEKIGAGKGILAGREIGFYAGIATRLDADGAAALRAALGEAPAQDDVDKAQRLLTALQRSIDAIVASDAPDGDAILGALQVQRNKYRQLRLLVPILPQNPFLRVLEESPGVVPPGDEVDF